MTTGRWFERPKALALLTLAFALVPAGIAIVTFRTARERDARLFETAADTLGEQLKVRTVQHVNFVNVLRSQLRYVADLNAAPRPPRLPPGWQQRIAHLRSFAYASHDDDGRITLRWQDGRAPEGKPGEDLGARPALSEAFERARRNTSPAAIGARAGPGLLAIVEPVTSATDDFLVRGYLIGWIDLESMCRDPSLPLVKSDALRARPAEGADLPGSRSVVVQEGAAEWRACITRGAEFSHEYGTPTPWLGFAALALSAAPLTVLVMLASRAGKFRAALDAERELGRMKSHFVNSVSHDFRTPLSVILSAADLLENYEGKLTPERKREIIGQIKGSTQHMTSMVGQVLMLGQLESGFQPGPPRTERLGDACEEIVKQVLAATDYRCPVESRIANGAAPTPVDATLLGSILGNLLSNAVKFSEPGTRVVLHAASSAEILELTVEDRGTGISEEDLPRVCEPFHRGQNSRSVPGTGLGLAIVQRTVTLHRGSLQIESRVREGTKVTVRLPGATGPPAQTATGEASAA